MYALKWLIGADKKSWIIHTLNKCCVLLSSAWATNKMEWWKFTATMCDCKGMNNGQGMLESWIWINFNLFIYLYDLDLDIFDLRFSPLY